MGNKRKNNPFLSPELQNLQDTINRISHMYSGHLQDIFSSNSINAQFHQLQADFLLPYARIIDAYTPTMVASLTLFRKI